MKFLAFYLPQYHTIAENDAWWGRGFTEWVKVKESVPLFDGHYQPRIPLEYYDLSNIQTMIDQSILAKKYGIHGFCYYHYWFCGKKLLEKPLERMLACREVDIPFCLSWANESWTRAWEGNNKQVLIKQDYGDEKDWDDHLNYLIPFFKDPRYIHIDSCPILLLYRTSSYDRFDEMISFWNERMEQCGLNPIYIIETLNVYQKKPNCHRSNAVLEFEPMFTISPRFPVFYALYRRLVTLLNLRMYQLFDYDAVWKKILRRRSRYKGKAVYLGAFVDWDNTPRRKYKATVFNGATPDKFFSHLLHQSQKAATDYLFINAWNEWAEGAYLEPDSKYKCQYLEAVKRVKYHTP